jgi:membrane protein
MSDEPLSKLRRFQLQVKSLFDDSVSALQEESALPRLHRFARFWILVVQSFLKNRCAVRATALAYTTLLAIVPVLAVVVSISTSLLKTESGKGQIDTLINNIIERAAPQLGLVSDAEATYKDFNPADWGQEDRPKIGTDAPVRTKSDARQMVRGFINSSINNVNSGALGATAMIGVIFVGISLLSNIETTLNDIWGVSRGRSWVARIIQYWAVLTLGPILLVAATSLDIGGGTAVVQGLLKDSPVTSLFLKLIPTVLMTVAFGLFYKLMPNTPVNWSAAFVGGFVSAGLLGLNNAFNEVYFGQVVKNSKIYGGLGALPIFLIGIYLSWLIILFGAQVAYAFQNRKAYRNERLAESVNEDSLEFIALRLMNALARHFASGNGAMAISALSAELGVPGRLIMRVLNPLLKAGLVVEVQTPVFGFTPGRPLESISYMDILEAIRTQNGRALPVTDPVIRARLESIRSAERETASAITLAIVSRSNS